MARYDVVIRKGLVADGLGGEPREADVAIEGGKIAAVGRIAEAGRDEIDARGLLVTPGFVDIHTHLDGHVTWTERLDPTSLHGITTAVFGNCGVGFAPCRPEDRDRLVALMEGVEDIPEPVLTEGLPWNWVSFGEYLDRLDARRFDIDVAAQLPHGPLRVFVMGQRAADREAATPEDRAQMARLTREAIEAGAIGFSTSRTLNHRASDGTHTPTLDCAEAELVAIAAAMREADGGVIQLISDWDDLDGEFHILKAMAEASGRPISTTLLQMPHAPTRWKQLLGRIEAANRDGLTVKGQVCGRPVGGMAGFEAAFNPFSFCPTFQSLVHLPFDQKVAALRQPDVKARIVVEFAVPIEERAAEIAAAFANRTVDLRNTARRLTTLASMYPLGDPPDYEPTPDKSVAALAARNGRPAADFLYDLLLERDGRTLLYAPAVNYTDGNLDVAGRMVKHPDTILGLSDSGAHNSLICDVSFTTYMLTHWARDRKDGMPLGSVVRELTARTAQAVGLNDRGVIAPGYRADINIIDFGRLRLHHPKVVYDLPAGGKRLTQEVDGYVMTMVKGVPTYREGVATGALPGRLIRGGQAAPAA